MAMTLGDILINVKSDTSQLVSGFNRAESAVNKTTKNMTTAVKTFAAAYIGLNAIDLARTLGRQADAMTNVNSKLKLVTSSSEELLSVQKEIYKISQDTRSSFTGNIDLYQRMSMATKNLNLSQKQMLDLTKTINESMTISGTTAEGARNLIIQLGQAFSSDFKAVAQELGTIRDQAPRLYQAMLAGTNMTAAAFKKAAEDGKLSSDIIIKALQEQGIAVDKDFGKMVITIDGASTQISNSIITTIGKLNDMTGASKFVADEISGIAKSIDKISPEKLIKISKEILLISASVGGAVIAIRTYNSTMALAATATSVYGGELGFVNRALILTTISTKALSAATKLIPFVAIASGLYMIADALLTSSNNSDKLAESLQSNGENLKNLTKNQLEYQKALAQTEMQQAEMELQSAKAVAANKGIFQSEESFKKDKALVDEKRKTFNDLRKLYLQINDTLNNIDNAQSKPIAKESTQRKDLTPEQQKLIQQAKELIDPTLSVVNAYNKMYEAIQQSPKGTFNTDDMNKFYESWQKAIDNVISKQEKLTQIERDWAKEKQKINDEISLSSLNGYDLQLKALENWRDSELEKYSSIAEAKAKIEQGYNSKLLKLNKEAAKNTLSTVNSMYSDMNSILGDMFDTNDARAKKMAEVNKALHTAQMVMNLAEMAQSTAFTSLFVANEAEKSTAAGTTAVAVAAQSSPWTGMATAAAMAAMLASIGIAIGVFGGNDTVSYTYDKFSAQKENTGAGTTLGDKSASSKSITDSLKLMSDLAKPEYRLFTQMNNSLMSIDQKIAGVSTLLLQQGGFAMGEGANIAALKTTPNLISKYQGSIIGGGLATISTDLISNALKTVIGDNFVSNIFSGITGAIGNAVSSVFGGGTSTSQSLYDYGITFNKQLLNGAIDSINGSAYQTIQTRVHTSGGLFSGSSTSYYYNSYFKSMDDSIKNQFQLILGNLYDTVVQSGQGLDTETQNIINTLDTFTVNLGKISFKGLSGQQIQDKLTAVFGKVGDQLAQTVFPELMPFQQVGEALYSTMIRVSSGVEQANYYISMLGKSFNEIKYTDIVNKQGDVALEALRQSIIALDAASYGANNGVIQLLYGVNSTASDLYDMYRQLETMRLQIVATGQSVNSLTSYMVLGAGGINELSDALSSYNKNFLTKQEQIALQTNELVASFDKLGISMPKSVQEFRNLVSSIDTSTSSGQQLYGQVLSLSDGFNNLASDMGVSLSDITAAYTNNINTIEGLINGLTDSLTNKNSLDNFNRAMREALNATDRISLSGALQDVSKYIGALSDVNNFTTSRDMEFAKAVARNQLIGIEETAKTQIDYLSSIANSSSLTAMALTGVSNVPTAPTSISNTSIVNNTTNYSDVISKLNDIITELKQQVSISTENRDINNASLIQLEDIAKVI